MISLHNSILNYYHYLRAKDEGQRSKVEGILSISSITSISLHTSACSSFPVEVQCLHNLLFCCSLVNSDVAYSTQ